MTELTLTQEERALILRQRQDNAIQYGERLAKAAERFMAEKNRASMAGGLPCAESWLGLHLAIHEFREHAGILGSDAPG